MRNGKKIFTVLFFVALLIINAVMCNASVDTARSLDFGNNVGNKDYGYRDNNNYNDNYRNDDGGNDYDYDDFRYDRQDDYDDDDFRYDGNAGGVVLTTQAGSDASFSDLSGPAVLGVALLTIGQVLPFLLFFLLVVIVIKHKKKKMNGSVSAVPQLNRLISTDVYERDNHDFSEQDFKEKLSNLYVRFQSAWQKKDMSDVQPFLSDAIFAQANRQLDAFRKKKETNIVDDICVLSVDIIGFKQDKNTDTVFVNIGTRIRDYVVDDISGKVVRGNKNEEKFMQYQWVLMKTRGTSAKKKDGMHAKSCPHCGAPININQSAVCEYCGSVLYDTEFDWVVNNIRAVSQRTK